MKFFKPEDFHPLMAGNLRMLAADTANTKLELELGNEYAIVNHFKAENEVLWTAIVAAGEGLANCEGGDARMAERKINEILDAKANNS